MIIKIFMNSTRWSQHLNVAFQNMRLFKHRSNYRWTIEQMWTYENGINIWKMSCCRYCGVKVSRADFELYNNGGSLSSWSWWWLSWRWWTLQFSKWEWSSLTHSVETHKLNDFWGKLLGKGVWTMDFMILPEKICV